MVAIGDFFTVGLIIILLEDFSVSFDNSSYAAEMVLDEEVGLEDEDAVIQFFPDDPSFGEGRAFEDECAVVVVDEESEGSGVLTSSSFPSREESLSETLVGCPTVFRRGQWMV